MTCHLIRYVASVLATQNPPDKELLKFLTDCLSGRAPMVRECRLGPGECRWHQSCVTCYVVWGDR